MDEKQRSETRREITEWLRDLAALNERWEFRRDHPDYVRERDALLARKARLFGKLQPETS